jgi:hypothetical protein
MERERERYKKDPMKIPPKAGEEMAKRLMVWLMQFVVRSLDQVSSGDDSGSY